LIELAWGSRSGKGSTFFNCVILEPGSSIMEEKMLLGIKEGAEGATRQQGRDGVVPGGMS
jgi:hypothetical protein